jgi:hypothetical protein
MSALQVGDPAVSGSPGEGIMQRLVTIGYALALFATIIVASCGGGAGMGLRQLVAVTVQPGNGEAIAPDGTVPFSATGTFDQAPTTQTNLPVQWASSDSNVATIDPNTGIATCLAVGGPITVTASAAGKGGMVHGPGTLACQISPDPVVKLDPTGVGFLCIYHFPVCSCTPPQTVTLTNVGGATLSIDSIAIVQSNTSFYQSSTCGTSVDSGQSCAISVGWRQHLTSGFGDRGQVEVNDNAGDSPQVVVLSGKAECIP